MTCDHILQALELLDIDQAGLDYMDRKFLQVIMEQFAGGPVGIDSLCAALAEVRTTLEDVIEPYLIQQGYVQRTARGRVVTGKGYQHFGLPMPQTESHNS